MENVVDERGKATTAPEKNLSNRSRHDSCLPFPALSANDIIEYRKACGITQREFADRFGIPLKTLQKWEQGLTSPRIGTASLLKNAMKNILPA